MSKQLLYRRNTVQHGDALLAYGNEGERQRGRCLLPALSSSYIDAVCYEIARVLVPSGYLMRWIDTFALCEGHHLRIADAVKCVDLIAWDNLHAGMGYRTRRRGDYLPVLQKPPLAARSMWRDHAIPSRWSEKVDRKLHPHIKPIGLIKRLANATARPGNLVVDPAAGFFVVLHAARELRRDFIGCDVAYKPAAIETSPRARELERSSCQLCQL
jgi:site-specific DNA-methyltransferase (adenine-specific)